MKKSIIFLFLLVSIQAFAAYQYNTKGNQTWLTFDSNTNLYFDVSRSGKTNDHENFIDRGEGIADWGWYNLNTNESGSFKNGGEFTFTENDKISVWVKDERGNTYASTKNTSDFIWGKSDTKDDIFKVYGGNKGSRIGPSHPQPISIRLVQRSLRCLRVRCLPQRCSWWIAAVCRVTLLQKM